MIYSQLCKSPSMSEIRAELEATIDISSFAMENNS